MPNYSIALGVRAPEVEDLTTAHAKVASLRSMFQAQKINEVQLEAAERANALGKQADADDKAAREIFARHTGPDGKLNQAGVLADLYKAGNVKGATAYQTQLTAQRKAELDQRKTALENAKEQNAQIGSAAGAVLNAPEADRPAMYGQVRAQLIQAGHNAAELPEAYDPNFVQAGYLRAIDADKQLAAHQKELELAQKELEYTDKRPGIVADAAVKTTEAEQVAKLGMTKKDRDTLDATAARDKATEAYRDEQTKIARGQLGVAQGRLGVEREKVAADRLRANPSGSTATGEEFLKTLPAGMAATVKAIAEGRQTNLPRDKSFGPLMQAVNQYDPSYTAQRGRLRNAFTTGPDGRNIGALNTAVDHLDQLHEAAKAMRNGTWQPGNRLYNYIAEKFGSAAPTNYAYVMNALAGETASALKGNATDPEIAHVMATLKADMSPEQAAGAAIAGLHVMGAKLNTYDERYHDQVPDDTWSPVLPTARSVFQRYQINPIRRGAPAAAPTTSGNSGGGHTPTPATADKIKFSMTASGPNGQRIGSPDGGATWFDVATGKKVQ